MSLFILSFFIAASAVASPQMLMYQGRILRNDGQALEYNGVTFEFSITNPSGSCIIYREISGANDMRNSKGIFDVPIGSGTKSFPVGPTFKLLDAFNNSTTSFSCEGGGTYSPVVGDMRLLRVQFHDGTGWKLISPDNKIGTVPFASYSLSSQKLGNNSASDFVLKTDIPVCGAGTYLRHIAPLGTFLCEAVTVPGTNVTGNIAGTAAGFSGALGGDVTGNQATTQVNALKGVPVSMTGIAVGKVLKYDGTNWAPADDLSSAGSVTSLTGDVTSTGSGAVATTISNSAVTTVKINDAAVTDVKIADGAVTAAKIPDGSIADSKLQTISTAGKVSGSAITSGTIGGSTVVNTSGLISTSSGLRVYNGANYVELAPPSTLGSNVSLKLPTTAGNNGDVLKINASGQMYWDIDVGAAGVVSSVNMAMPSIFTVSGGPITTSGTLTATLNSQAANQFFASPDGSAGAPVFRAIAAADLPVVPVSRGGTGSSTALNNNRVMSSSGGLIVESAAITANRAVISDANGIPTHSAVTNTELAFLSGVTSSIQTQLNAKAGNSSWTNYSAMASDGSGNLIAVPGTVSGSLLQFSPTGPVWGSASFPTSTTANQILYSSANNVVGGLATANNAILTTNGSGVPSWSVISNDSFAQYALLAGRTGGQTLQGGVAASENLTLDSTSHGTKGFVLINPTGGNVGIGTVTPGAKLEVAGQIKISGGTPGVGKILTSDAAGLATWETIATVAAGTEGQTLRNSAGTWVADSSFFNNGANTTLAPAGAGTRMIWYPHKSAFRAGIVGSTEWDDANIGLYSVATGRFTTASGTASTALGRITTASGSFSTAMGSSTLASGDRSTAMGYSTTASGAISTAMGSGTTASGSYSTAMGSNTTAESFAQTTVGYYNLPLGTEDPASWVATDPLFVVGNGTGSGARSTALMILKNGNVGIGTSTAGAKLEVAGQIKITGGTPGAGKVLTSDASGLATWETAAAGNPGTVTNVSSANADIAVADGSAAPILTLNSGSAGGAGDANKIAKLDGSGLLATAMIPNVAVSKITGVLPIANGGTNSSTALNNNRIMASTGGAIVEAAAITAGRALLSDANGIPAHSAVTSTELGYLSGVTSAVQTQIDGKLSSSGFANYSAMVTNGSGAVTTLPGSASGSILNWSVTGPVWTSATFPTSTTANQILYSSANNVVGGLATASNAILTTNGSGVPSWSVISNDSFAQYALLAGRSGGQTLNGGTAASENLTLDSTAHATKGNILLASSGGNVGIGTGTPVAKLDVYGMGSGAAPATTGATDATTNFRVGRGSVGVNIGTIDSGVSYIQNRVLNNNATNYGLSLQPNGGNLGIGTTAPSSKLHVAGGINVDPSLVYGTAATTIINGGSQDIAFGSAITTSPWSAWIQVRSSSNVADPLALNPLGGNVGIGTLTPATKLDVSGTVSVDSSIETASALVNSGAAYTIPDSSVNIRRVTLNANTTITLPAFSSPAGKVWSLTVIVVQDATGGRTLTWAAPGGNSIKWDMGATPGPSTGASKTSIFQFIKPSDDTVWYGSMVWREN